MERSDAETFPALLAELANERGDALAAVDDEGRERTFTAIKERSDAIAASLCERGLGPGDRVAIVMENRVEWVETMFGVLRAGATVVGVSTWGQKKEVGYYLANSKASAVVATEAFVGTDYVELLDDLLGYRDRRVGETAADDYPDLETVVFLASDSVPGAVSFDDLDGDPAAIPDEPNDPDDTALLLYTSGSTSKPKGVPLRHGAIIENAYQIGERMNLESDDRVWLASPLFWSYGSANALAALYTHGGSLALQAPFDPGVAVELMDEYECTVYYGMTNMARQIADADGFTLQRSHFRTGTTIGPPEDVEFTMDELGIPELCNVYGSTETYGNCAVTDSKLERGIRLTTAGRALPGQEIVIKDPDDSAALPSGETGEICVRGRVTSGYHDDPEKTAAAFDDEGYFHTGDLGRLDENGHVQFRGRLKSMIKTGGINVSPVEVEEFLMEHPGVDQAYVVGREDAEKDQVVAAVVVPVDDSLTEADVREHARGLAAYKRPARIVFASGRTLPTTDTGKIQKRALGELF